MNANDVRWIQVENTTKCNAWCPACARNNNGFELNQNLILEDLDVDLFERHLQSFQKCLQACGSCSILENL